jgi:hypothetical protein
MASCCYPPGGAIVVSPSTETIDDVDSTQANMAIPIMAG